MEKDHEEAGCSQPLLDDRIKRSSISISKKVHLEHLDTDEPQPTCSTLDKVHHSNNNLTESKSGNASQKVIEIPISLSSRLHVVINKPEIDMKELHDLLNENTDPGASCNEISGVTGYQKLFAKMGSSLWHHFDKLPQKGTPLHSAAFRGHEPSVRLLLSVGADPNICDSKGRTALDVAGLAHFCNITTPEDSDNLTKVIRLIKEKGGQHKTMKAGGINNVHTALHAAALFNNMDAAAELVNTAFVACWDKNGKTPLHVCVEKEAEDVLQILITKGPDVKDCDGRTVLHAAVAALWLPGVRIALGAGADVTLKAKDGTTPLHAAAIRRSIGSDKKELSETILDEILSVAKQKNVVDCLNEEGKTALFTAVQDGDENCVQTFLRVGALITHTTKDNLNVLHVAANRGNKSILQMVIDFDKQATAAMINSLTTPILKGFAPIHFAVSANNVECVRILKSQRANLVLETTVIPYGSTTPLHMAAANNYVQVAECILDPEIRSKSGLPWMNNPTKKFDGNGWLPLHCAIYRGSDVIIKLLLNNTTSILAEVKRSEKALFDVAFDVTRELVATNSIESYKDFFNLLTSLNTRSVIAEIMQSKKHITALDMIMEHITNPTEYLKNFFDSCVSVNVSTSDIEINYKVLLPERGLRNEMAVVEALLNTGNKYDQKKLLTHPLMESLIYLKWRAVMPLYFVIAAMYAIFVASLASFEISAYHEKDTNNGTNAKWSGSIDAECSILYVIISLIILLELLLVNVEGIRYFKKRENWVKFFAIGLAISVPPVVMEQEWEKDDWPRHVAAVALLSACAQMLNIISQFPSWGYYVVMFKKVACNVLKVMGTFAVLIFAFAVCFMIQFRFKHPFNSPFDAFVKTLFLLTAEFEYNSLFSEENANSMGSSFQVARLIFVVFLILACIVLMNMIVGVAVDDITNLKAHGKIGKLEKQARFVSSLDKLDYFLKNKVRRHMQNNYGRQLFPLTITLEGEVMHPKPIYSDGIMPKRFRDAFSNIAQKNKEEEDEQQKKQIQSMAGRDKNDFNVSLMVRLDALEAKINRITSLIENSTKNVPSELNAQDITSVAQLFK